MIAYYTINDIVAVEQGSHYDHGRIIAMTDNYLSILMDGGATLRLNRHQAEDDLHVYGFIGAFTASHPVDRQDKRNRLLFCKRTQLQAGDVIEMCHTFETIQDGDQRLSRPDTGQGYYRYRLVGGPTYEAFKASPEQVADWSPGARCWQTR